MTSPQVSATDGYLAALVRAAGTAIVGLAPNGQIESWNSAAEQLFGYATEEALGQPLAEHIHLDQHAEQELLATAKHAGRTVTLATRCKAKNEQVVDVLLVSTAIVDEAGQITGIAATFTNIVTQNQAATPMQHEAPTRSILRHFVTAQEDERRRIAIELHEQVGQSLSGLHFRLAVLDTEPQLPVALRSHIARLQDVVEQLSTQVNHLALELRPSTLDHLDLAITLQQYVETWALHTDIMAEFEHVSSVHDNIPPEIATMLYRGVQAMLTNIHQHAHARNASVILNQHAAYVSVIVEDDGIEFDTQMMHQTPDGQQGLGLLALQEYAALMQGILTIESAPGQGTTVFIRVPLPPTIKEADRTA